MTEAKNNLKKPNEEPAAQGPSKIDSGTYQMIPKSTANPQTRTKTGPNCTLL
jgi:hypothetical protein